MLRMHSPSQRYTIPFLLVLWFFIWGICPWSGSPSLAQTDGAAHPEHGHHEMDDTHHASKGTEHSCSGAISYSSKLQKDRPYEQVVSIQQTFFSTYPAICLGETYRYQKPLFERSTLPKLLTEYYQLYSIYRI